MKDVIVSFATKSRATKSRENYHGMILRLIDSCKDHWKGDLLIYSPDHDLWMYRDVPIVHSWPDPEGLPSFKHNEMPYQFKTALIQKAIELGYERVIWLDSSMQLKKDLTPLFDTESGITVFENLGHPTWKYLSDQAANKLFGDIDYTEWLKQIPQIWGGAFALDLTKQKAKEFFTELKEYSCNGSFKESGSTRTGFIAHRHDQSVMSVLLHNKCTLLPYGQILNHIHDITGEYGTDPYLVCRGL